MLRKKIALIFAMEVEARGIIEALHLKRDETYGDPNLPFQHYRGDFNHEIELLLSLNGKDKRHGVDNIGTEPSTLNAYITLKHFKPDLIVNAGTAGGFLARNAKIGDVYMSTDAFRFHDRRIAVPGFDLYGVGHYPVFSVPNMASTLDLKEGVVTTANSLDYSDKDLVMMNQNNGSVKEMEAAGIGWVAHTLNVPFFALKSVTDFVDSSHPTAEQFQKNLHFACQNLNKKVIAVLNYLSKNLSDW